MHFDASVDEVDDPVIRHARTGIQAGLAVAIKSKGCVSDFYDQFRMSRMMIDFTDSALDHAEVGLGLGTARHAERLLIANDKTGWKGLAKLMVCEANGKRVIALLRRHFNDLPANELNVLALEPSLVRQTVVLFARPAPAIGLGQGMCSCSTGHDPILPSESDVKVHAEFVRMRPDAQGVDLIFPLVFDPVMDHIRSEHVARQQKIVVLFQCVAGVIQ